MAQESFIIEAILKARDEGFSKTMQEASKGAATLQDTIKGMSAAQLAIKGLSKAWDMVTSSVGSAMGRIDTMDQFARTMELMTGNSDLAAEALDRVNDSVKGTAYGLDTAAAAVQGFVTSGKDVGLAIDTVTNWGDALATFGQATNENLATVTTALQKMSNSGKVSMQQLQMLTDRGIPAVELFADATGKSTQEVTAAISKGQVSADEFITVMNRAFTEGTSKFPAVAGAAKEAGASWSATIGNMHAAVTRGVQGVINAIEEGRKKSDLPGMKEGVADFGKSVESVLKGVAKVAGFVAENFELFKAIALPALAGFAASKSWDLLGGNITKLQENLKQTGHAFSTMLKGKGEALSVSETYAQSLKVEATAEKIRSAAAEHGLIVDKQGNILKENGKAISEAQQAALLKEAGAMTTYSMLQGVLAGKIKVTTIAKMALNKAFAANPIGIMTGGIMLAITGIKKATEAINKSNKALQQARKEAQAENQALEQLNSQENELTKTFERTNKGLDQRKEKANAAVKALREISKQNLDVEEKQAAVNGKVKELQELYPDLVIDAEHYGDAIDENTDIVERQLNTMDQLSKLEVWKKYSNDLAEYRDQLEIEIKVTEEMIARMQEAGTDKEKKSLFIPHNTEEFDALVKNLERAKESYQLVSEQAEIAAEETSKYDEAQLNAELSAAQLSAQVDILTSTYGLSTQEAQAVIEYNQRMAESFDANVETIQGMAEQMGIGGDEVVTIMENMDMTAEQLADHYEEVYNRVDTAVNSMVQAAGSGFEQIQQKEALTWEDIMTNLEANQQALETWNENIQILMEAGVDQGVIEKLREMGASGAEQTDVLVKSLEDANGEVITKGGELSTQAQNIVDEVNGKFKELYKTIEESAKTELDAEKYIEQGKAPIEGIVKGLATATVENEADINKALKEVNRKVEEGNKDVKKTADKLGEELVKSVDKTGEHVNKSVKDSTKETVKTADRAGEEFNRSIEKTSHKSQTKVDTMAKELGRAFDNLPNDLQTAGVNAIQGLINGINSQSGAAYNAMANVARQVVSAYQNELQIHSPSRVMEKNAEYTVSPLLAKLKEGAQEAANLAGKMARNLDFSGANRANIGMGTASLSSQYGASGVISGKSASESQPLALTLVLGGQEYTAFVQDIFSEQDKQLRLKEVYS